MPPTKNDFSRALKLILDAAQASGKEYIDVNAGDLHRKVGDYPGNHRLPICCQVMRNNMQFGDSIIAQPPKGVGASLTIRYNFPRHKNQTSEEIITPSISTSDDETSNVIQTPSVDITANVNEYLENRNPDKRYASFDYCYNYFRQYYESNKIKDMVSPENMQLSCLQLGFYLASWGMFRGKAFLLQKSVKHYAKLIHTIAGLDKKYWEIDADKYTDDNIHLLLKLYEIVENALGDNDDEAASATLVTKVMLGVFANVPALDENFCSGLGYSKYFSRGLLKKIGSFYMSNRAAIDCHEIKTLDFSTGNETSYLYTKAKIIDMVGFIEGLKS